MGNRSVRRGGIGKWARGSATWCAVALGGACGGGPEAKPAAKEPHPAPTFELAPPEGSLSPELSSLVADLEPSNPRMAESAKSIKNSGSLVAQQRGGRKLVQHATDIASPAWVDSRRQDQRDKNATAGFTASDAQLATQLERMQTEALAPVYVAMEQLGGEEVVRHAFQVAANKAIIPERRSMAFGVLAANVGPDDPRAAEVKTIGQDVERLVAATFQAGASLTSASEAVANLRTALKKCFDDVLPKNPNLKVKGTLALRVDLLGNVVESTTTDLAPPELAACVEKAGRNAKFPASSAGAALTVPVVFIAQ